MPPTTPESRRARDMLDDCFSAAELLTRHLANRLAETGISTAESEAPRIVAAAAKSGADLAQSAELMLQQRLSGMPLAYVVGSEPFLGIDILTGRGALIPRRETELLGRTAIDAIKELSHRASARIVDMCCGAGNLACAIAASIELARVWAADLTDDCVSLTARNVAHHGFGDRIEVVQSDLFAALAGLGLERSVDVAVCNPPYISSAKLEASRHDLLAYEPRTAFDGGPYGLSIQQRVISEAMHFLRPGGALMFEIGAGQGRQISRLFERAKGYDAARLVSDESGEPRVAIGRRRED
jgi:release factor glutamine methyltransferase